VRRHLGACLLVLLATAGSVRAQDGTRKPAAPIASDPGPTPAEFSAFADTPTYAETWAYLTQLAASCRHIHVSTIGYTFRGYPIPAVFVWDRSSGDGGAWEEGLPKPVIMITAGIHSGEICGKDALLLLLRDIARGAMPDVIQHLRLILVPIFNVDGHEDRSLYHRFVQVGPACGTGTRRNARNYDLNRDFCKLDTPECRAVVRLAAQFAPHIYMDLHTNDGFRHQYEMVFACPVNPTFPGEREAFVREVLKPGIISDMAADGFRSHPMAYPIKRLAPAEGMSAFGITSRYSTGYFETRQTIGILAEAYPYISYERRVRATESLLRSVLSIAASHRLRLCEVVWDARRRAIRWAREPGEHRIALGCHADRSRSRMITWLGKEMEIVASSVTGNRFARYGESDHVFEVPFYDRMIPDTSVVMPRGYLLDGAWGEIADRLRQHAIVVRRLTAPLQATVEAYRISSVEFEDEPYQGHITLRRHEGVWSRETRRFPPGTYWIPLDHPAGFTAVHLLEPASTDAYLHWNGFDSIFERGIILGREALEENASRLIEDPAIRAEYDAMLADSTFANNPKARLEFFFRQTPYASEDEGLYPVFRLSGDAPPSLGP